MKRMDNWTKREDEMLAATVLRNLREGNTQLTAFGEASTILGRTYAACNFRWNKYLRNKKLSLFKEAKKIGKESRKGVHYGTIVTTNVVQAPTPADTDLHQMIRDYVHDLILEALSQKKG
ncbi:hypothetical protein [Paenibacillus silvisoli]|uniref:hypothetical protein n=1 Tax=Paenibacillus silvisoli TaxID=3110539 RepID=UPI0028062B5B|nr:hypothetical protein [Paenibacillus silvisoli]